MQTLSYLFITMKLEQKCGQNVIPLLISSDTKWHLTLEMFQPYLKYLSACGEIHNFSAVFRNSCT